MEDRQMITAAFTESKKALVVDLSGELTEQDFTGLARTIDDHINQADDIPNLVLHISKIPHWDSFNTLKTHFKLVKAHHQLISKVAVVSDTLTFAVIPYIMDHFLAAKVRHFPAGHLDDATLWAEAEDDHPGAFEILEDLPRDVVGIQARGVITAQDYEQVLVPLVEEKLKTHDHLKLLFVLDDSFEGYSEAAAWDDMRFGFGHFGDFSRIAIVTDIGWIRHGAKLFGPLVGAQVHIFDVGDLAVARSWIKR